MEQLLSYNETIDSMYFITRFIDGLKDEIRSVVLVHCPLDLDTAIALAQLQEEAHEGGRHRSAPKPDDTFPQKTSIKASGALPLPLLLVRAKPGGVELAKDRRGVDAARAKGVEDKLAALRAYCLARGLCFKCREKWSKDHRCAATVQLYVLEDLLEFFQVSIDSEEGNCTQLVTAGPTDATLMAISRQAVQGTEAARTVRIVGRIQ
uniref:Uncharacterized protein n=1 Tax=Arundo donax TaxID=35708 RepID=A0A0A9BS31_ARUDO